MPFLGGVVYMIGVTCTTANCVHKTKEVYTMNKDRLRLLYLYLYDYRW